MYSFSLFWGWYFAHFYLYCYLGFSVNQLHRNFLIHWTASTQSVAQTVLLFFFYGCMTLHFNRLLVNKTNRCNEFQFYWYYESTCFGQPFCPSSGVLSRLLALVHFMQLWWPVATRSRMELSSDSLQYRDYYYKHCLLTCSTSTKSHEDYWAIFFFCDHKFKPVC